MRCMNIVACNLNSHGRQILSILNEAILNTTARYEYEPRPLESMVAWFEEKIAGQFPVIGLEDAEGNLAGFGTYGTFRGRPAYKYSVEHSVYVKPEWQGKGCGGLLLGRLIELARS